jgi:glutamyl-tRNA synthetase
MTTLKHRAQTIPGLHEASRFLHDLRPIALNDKQAAMINDQAKERIRDIATRLEGIKDWSEPVLKAEIDAYCAEKGVGMGKIGPVLRVILTGGAPAPDISLVLALLGRNEALARLADLSEVD